MSSEQNEGKPKSKRGFASMDPEAVKRIASAGGKAAHAKGTAHQFTSEEAREVGRKGGLAPHVKRGRGAQHQPTKRPTAEERTAFLPMPLDGDDAGVE